MGKIDMINIGKGVIDTVTKEVGSTVRNGQDNKTKRQELDNRHDEALRKQDIEKINVAFRTIETVGNTVGILGGVWNNYNQIKKDFQSKMNAQEREYEDREAVRQYNSRERDLDRKQVEKIVDIIKEEIEELKERSKTRIFSKEESDLMVQLTKSLTDLMEILLRSRQ